MSWDVYSAGTREATMVENISRKAWEPYGGVDLGQPGRPSLGWTAPQTASLAQVPGVGLGAGALVGGVALPGGGGEENIMGLAGAIPAAASAAGIALPAWLLTALGLAGAGYGIWQGLGGGEGGGLFGNNLLGGDDFTMGGLEFGGPGLPEPTAPYKEWHVGNKQFYYVPQYSPTTGKFTRAKVAMYNKDTKLWKVWTLPKPHLAVIGKNRPSHRMLTRLRQNLRRHVADSKTILQVASPAYYAKTHGYYKRRRK